MLDTIYKDPSTAVVVEPDGQIHPWQPTYNPFFTCDVNHPHIYPGSWDPFHKGHREVWNSITATNKYFEISIKRIGKPDLTVQELAQRIRCFEWFAPIIVTNAPTFMEKKHVLGTCNFHIGYDTAQRIIDAEGRAGAESLTPCMFYVYHRMIDGMSQSIDQWFTKPFNFIPVVGDREFSDISSTQIRKATQQC